jgi:hypothetical protein
MGEESGKKKGGGRKRGRRDKDRHFMDAALDAYIRSLALQFWRDFIVYRDRQEKSAAEALREAGYFEDRGEYGALWSAHWARIALPAAERPDGEIFGQIEAAVRAAVLAEKAARLERGAPTLEDTDEYNGFLRQTLNQLLTEASAETEP